MQFSPGDDVLLYVNLAHDCTKCSICSASSFVTGRGGNNMFKRTVVLMAAAVAVAALLITASSTQASMSAMAMSKVNHLTFSGSVRLPGTLLTPGTYTFEAGPKGTDRNIVRVTTRDGGRVLFLGFTTPVSRRASGPMVLIGEAPAGAPQPIAVWYEDGERTGHEFRY
jgi:hypothetical protein